MSAPSGLLELPADVMPNWDGGAPDDDSPPINSGAANDTAPLVCQQEGCGNALEYSGSGRRPRFCEDHKTAASRSGGRTKRGRNNVALTAGLEQVFMMAAMTLGGATLVTQDPVWMQDGAVIRDNAHAMAAAWSDYADRNPKVRKALENMIKGAGIGGIIVATAPVVIQIAGNHIQATRTRTQDGGMTA